MFLTTITAGQIVAHLIGDYVIQSDWMANEKTKKLEVALLHAIVYAIPFVFLLPSWWGLVFIVLTHAVIDRYRLAKYVVYAKNFLAPASTIEVVLDRQENVGGKTIFVRREVPHRWWHPWEECTGTGYHKDRPPWMSVWLLIIADNTLHLLCNAFALAYL